MTQPQVIEPLVKGTFKLYETPGGGMRIAFILEGNDEEKVAEIPAAVMRMAAMAGKGNPIAMLKGLADRG